MKANAVFYMAEGVLKFLQVSDPQRRLVNCVDVINTAGLHDTQISEVLASFKSDRKLNFAQTRVTLVIPRSRAILRFMTFPSHQEDEIRSMIELQVGSRIPYVREEVEIDHQILSKTDDGYSKVAVVIIPQELAMRYWQIFADARVPVDTITISSVGLWLFYLQQPGLSQEPLVLFDMDIDHSEICLCDRGYWMAAREIPTGFVQIEQNGYAEILNQWELTPHNTGAEKPAADTEKICVVSSANRAPALGSELTAIRSSVTVKEVLLTQTLNLARGVKWPKAVAEEGVSMAPLAGVALSPQKPPIDLIPRSVRQAQEQRAYHRQLIILAVWIAAAMVSLGLTLGIGFLSKNVQLARLENKLREARREAAVLEKQLQKVNDIEGMIKNRLIFSDLAREIDHLLPAPVYLVNITISNGDSLSLQGVSTNTVAINQFQKEMSGSHRFSNVSLDYVNKRITQQGEVDYFKITCTLNVTNVQK